MGKLLKPKTFDDILEHLGAFGHGQRIIFVLISVADIWGAFVVMSFLFIGAVPWWRCTEYTNKITGEHISSQNMSWINMTETVKSCSLNGTDYTCSGFEFKDEFTSIVSKWNLVCHQAYVTDMIISIQSTGSLLAAFFFGQLSDLIGRKPSYFIAMSFTLIPALISAFVPMWEMFAACRLLVGFGFGGQMVVNFVYTLEFVGVRWRTLCGTIGFWAFGCMILGLLGHFIRNWIYLTIVTAASGFVYYATLWFIPESPRWLIQKRRFEEAEDIIRNIAEQNKKPVPDLSGMKKIAEEQSKEEEIVKKYSYLDLFKQPVYCKRTLILMVVWFTTYVIYYQISFNLRHLSGNRYLNMFLGGLVDWGAMLSVIAGSKCLGRRIFMVLISVLCLISNVGIFVIYLTGNKDTMPDLILAFALLGRAATLAGCYIVAIFSAELYPTVIRNLGVGAGSTASRIGNIIAPQLVLLGTYFLLAPYIIGMILCLLMIPLGLCLPETKGKPLLEKYETTETIIEKEPSLEANPDETSNMLHQNNTNI